MNVVGLKLCTVFCLCFALSLQSSEVSWVFYVSSSSYCFLNILLLLSPCLRLTCMKKEFVTKKKRKKERNAGCWNVFFFFLVFLLPQCSIYFPLPPIPLLPPLNGMKKNERSINIFPRVSIFEDLSGENAWKKKHLAQNVLGALLAWPAVHNHLMYCIMLPMINIAALEAILTCINRTHPTLLMVLWWQKHIETLVSFSFNETEMSFFLTFCLFLNAKVCTLFAERTQVSG